jgi:hypothetical protein
MLRWSIPILLLGLGLTGAYRAFLRRTERAPFIVLNQPYRTPVFLRDQIGRWVPASPSWSWAWRLEQAVFGQRKPLRLNFAIVRLASSPGSAVPDFDLGAPAFSATNGLRTWLLDKEALKALQERFRSTPGANVLSRPRFSTADGIDTRMFAGETIPINGSSNQVGLSIGCYGQVRPHTTDLIASITFSELVTNEAKEAGGSAQLGVVSIRTNMDAAFRLQIPKGKGMYVLDGRPADDRHSRIGVILDPP